MNLQHGKIMTISEIAKRIKYLESVKDEYTRKKAWKNIEKINARLDELYLVLGVKK